MPPAIFCPKCGQKSRSERHICQPTALAKIDARRKALAAIQAAKDPKKAVAPARK